MSNNDEIKFGIRKTVLAKKVNRKFLKEKFAKGETYNLTVITDVIDGCIAEVYTYMSSYKPLDLTKFPNDTNSSKWQDAITYLIKSEKNNDVLWFDSPYSAASYIQSAYPNDEE